MEPEKWSLLRELFGAAVLLAPDERASFLDRECGSDADLRREVESLLRHDPGPGNGAAETAAVEPEGGDAGSAASLVGGYVGKIRILSLLGKGGMGEVYIGFDETLRRRVAVKAIRAKNRLAPESRARFLREARILSQLEHPHICRVYDYVEGDDSDFLVLELIDGVTLSEKIDAGLLPGRRMVIAIQLAEVLAAAHAKGVVHRDLKPQNVMITTEGETKVLDFGLARLEAGAGGPSASAGDEAAGEPLAALASPAVTADETAALPEEGHPDLAVPDIRTRRGAVVGTPIYMSPEQAHGEAVTTASDMYSYGLVLQTLFTGEAPYPKGLDGLEILARARRAETRPVTGIDRDLAAFVDRLKSVAPAARPTAATALERLRWIRNKPARRLRRMIAAVALAVFALGGAKYTFDLRSERTIALEARDEADLRRGQAEDLIGFMLGDLRTKLAPVNRLEVLDDIGDKALGYFAAVPAEELSSRELLFRSKSLSQIGQVRMDQGDLGEAMEAFEESLVLARGLVERDPANGDGLAWLGSAHFWIGWVDFKRGELDPALASFRQYLDVSRELVEREPGNLDWQLELSYAHNNVGAVLRAQGKPEDAIEAFRSSLAIKRHLLVQQPDNSQWKSDLAKGHVWLGGALLSVGDLDGALRSYRANRELGEELVREQPANSRWRYSLGIGHQKIGSVLEMKGLLQEALVHFETYLEVNQDLVGRDNENATWQRELAVAHGRVGRALASLGKPERGLDHLVTAESILQTLVALDPSNADWQQRLASYRISLAYVLASLGQTAETLNKATEAVESCAALAEENRADSSLRLLSSRSYQVLGEVQLSLGRADEAAVSFLQTLEAIEPSNHALTDPHHRAIRARALLRLGRLDEAAPIVADLYRQGYRRKELERLSRENGVWP